MPVPQFLSLTGYRATGKSTVGRLLAERLGYDFIDTDNLVVQAAGKEIAAIFSEDGEKTFRDFESEAVASVIALSGVIVSLGGGAILRKGNRDLLKQAGPVVWLTASAEVIRQRLIDDGVTAGQRPSLLGESAVEEVEAVLLKRTPLYAEVSDCAIDTSCYSATEIAKQIASKYFPFSTRSDDIC